MTRIPRPATAGGQFETEAEARAAVAHVYQAADATTRRGVMTGQNHEMLCEAIDAAEVTMGAYDHRIITWLAESEPQACAVIAGLITRAHQAGGRPVSTPAPAALAPADALLVIQSLDMAGDWRRYLCEVCESCPGGSCPVCRKGLAAAEAYDALRERMVANGRPPSVPEQPKPDERQEQ